MHRLLLGLCATLFCVSASALSLSDVSQRDASTGLKDALSQGAQIAVKQLGSPGGFNDNPDVRIELPGKLGKAAKTLKMLGLGTQVDAVENSLNAAAEAAVPQVQAILLDSVKKMTISDAKAILAGGQDSATRYLDSSSREQIRARFLPIVKQTTDKIGLAQQYNALAGRAASIGAADANSVSVENYVTEQALNGLFDMIAQQEANIRENPAGAATAIARKIFGAVQ
ncbi:DUF4197 domain-containing protein [Pseudomonas matsuisoli]|uniref:DUF4197 domain-containing protein n=1 Tax=Pseudomonas matsuisoli TaxID=1515666 RepID=A0A917PHD8_9PSED|nr:DUF4197 domain-containing protein [Pseudomonas matsuisoli]GGJ78504.1 hypothetical protein GCM10009304_00510 [Pseudomonas matsuisoli]